MAVVKPFKCIRPAEGLADKIAALPYDVYSREEACKAVAGNGLSFLNIDRAETQFDSSVCTYDDRVYDKARELLDNMVADGSFTVETNEYYYIYELTMNKRTQTGLVACASVDDYVNNVIKKHENTREDKEIDRIRHVDTCNAQTGPIFLAYRTDDVIKNILNRNKKKKPLYDFISDDGISHRVWKIDDTADMSDIVREFKGIDDIYIADGHHRAASAVKVGLKRRENAASYDGSEEFNYFLAVLFADDELMIMPYNRVVKDLNGSAGEEFVELLRDKFDVVREEGAFSPEKKGDIGMYLEKKWYRLTAKDCIRSNDSVGGLDVSLLQNHILAPLLGIKDPKTDKRIDFVGGIRGNEELERRCGTDMAVAFSMYPTSIAELFAVSDAGLLMPPKSTWFEPKLRSGLFIHSLS